MPELRRQLGLLEAVVYGVGLILGAGIYAILGEATGVTGGSIVISFLLAALIASLTGLSYAELASLFPKAEGDYIYVREAFDRGYRRISCYRDSLFDGAEEDLLHEDASFASHQSF